MRFRGAAVSLLLFALVVCAQAQKLKVGYDKSADFSKYRTYSWLNEMSADTTLLRAAIMSEIHHALQEKGLNVVEEGSDLLLEASGAIGGEVGGVHQDVITPSRSEFYYPAATAWGGAPLTSGGYVTKGALVLRFVDRSTKKVVWEGAVSEKMDGNTYGKNQKRIENAIRKLLEKFPPTK